MSDSWAPAVGTNASWSHVISSDDVVAFVELSGDGNPVHVDDAYAQALGYEGRIAHGALIGAFISRVLAERLPGPGSVSLSYELHFAKPVYVGTEIICRVTVRQSSAELGAVVLAVDVVNPAGEQLVHGTVRSLLPPQPD